MDIDFGLHTALLLSHGHTLAHGSLEDHNHRSIQKTVFNAAAIERAVTTTLWVTVDALPQYLFQLP